MRDDVSTGSLACSSLFCPKPQRFFVLRSLLSSPFSLLLPSSFPSPLSSLPLLCINSSHFLSFANCTLRLIHLHPTTSRNQLSCRQQQQTGAAGRQPSPPQHPHPHQLTTQTHRDPHHRHPRTTPTSLYKPTAHNKFKFNSLTNFLLVQTTTATTAILNSSFSILTLSPTCTVNNHSNLQHRQHSNNLNSRKIGPSTIGETSLMRRWSRPSRLSSWTSWARPSWRLSCMPRRPMILDV